MRLSEHQTNDLIARLEERKYGHRLNSMQLAQRADVPLDMVNRVENQLPIDDAAVVERVAGALGVTADLLCKVAGLTEIAEDELRQLDVCIAAPPSDRTLQAYCERIGLRALPLRGERAA